MPRPQFTSKTMLWLMAVVGVCAISVAIFAVYAIIGFLAND